MEEKRILIAEDDVSTAIMLVEFLNSRGYAVEAVNNGKEACERYSEKPAQIVITDINMPVMGGNELITHLNHLEIPPVIFVTTSNKNPDLIIDIMRKGVYDYILKPVDMGDLLLKLARAFDIYEMKRAMEISQREKIIRLENSLEWYKFEEKVHSRDLKSMGDNIFQSLLTSFNQGSGFGGLVTLMSLMKSTAVKEGEFYKVNEDLFKLIIDNAESAEKAINVFGDISKISAGKKLSEKIKIADLHDSIAGLVKELEPLAILEDHRMIFSDKKKVFNDMYIEINRDHFSKAFREILLNSLKFSPPHSEIVILFLIQDENLSIRIINDVNLTETGHKGIPLGYENLVFEPFFRLTKNVYEQYKTLDYGLGLTLVQKILSSYGCGVSIGNITDHSDIKVGPKIRVEFSVAINILRDKA